MVHSFVLLLLLPLLATVSAQFNPTISVTCNVGPSYTFALTSASATGVIFVDGQCEAQATAVSGSYTFDADSCTVGTVPALGSEFKVVVQEYSTINLATDKIVKVTCTLDTSSITQTTSVGASGEDYDTTDSPTVAPTFTVDFQSSTGTAITSGNVGDGVQIVLSIPSAEAAVFDYQITTLSVAAAGGSTVTMIDSGCTQFSSVISQPSAQSGGSLTVGFNLFIPKDTSSSPTLPGTSSTSLTFTFEIEVCDASCTAPTCSKRKRRSSNNRNNSTYNPVELAATLLVYPPGHKSQTVRSFAENKSTMVEEACLSRTPIIGILAGLSVALFVCPALTAIMFCKARRPASDGSKISYSNTGHKA